MEPKVITALPNDEMRLVKQIIIVTESKYNYDMSIGYILYERRLTDDYKFKEIPVEERDLNYYINYRNADIYPFDKIDALILQSIKDSYPKSFVKNHSIVFNVDEENIALLVDRPFEKSLIRITPDFRSVDDISKLAGRQFSGLLKDIKIYADSDRDNIRNLVFFGHYNINDTKILNEINNIKIL